MTPRHHAIELLDHLAAVHTRRSNEARLHGYLTAAKTNGVKAGQYRAQADILRAADELAGRRRPAILPIVKYMDDTLTRKLT